MASDLQRKALPMNERRRDFYNRWQTSTNEIARLCIELQDASFELYERGFLALQRKLLTTDPTEWERRETRRRIAEEILNGAYFCDASWADFSRALRRIHRLGYSNLERRLHVTVIFARWAKRHPEHLPAAKRWLSNLERNLRSASPRTKHYNIVKESLEQLRQEKEFVPEERR